MPHSSVTKSYWTFRLNHVLSIYWRKGLFMALHNPCNAKKKKKKKGSTFLLSLQMLHTLHITYLVGEDSQICRFGVCLLITYVPMSPPNLTVKTPLLNHKENSEKFKFVSCYLTRVTWSAVCKQKLTHLYHIPNYFPNSNSLEEWLLWMNSEWQYLRQPAHLWAWPRLQNFWLVWFSICSIHNSTT